MLDWYYNLEQRERTLVSWGAVVLALIVFYLVLLEPLQQKQQQSRLQYDASVKLLEFMQQKNVQVTELRQNLSEQKKRPADKKLVFLVERTLQQAKIDSSLKSIVPQQQGGLQLRFDSVNFDSFISWLINFHNVYGINVEQLSVAKTADAGFVRASVLFN